jgi:hypothetical protein
MKYFSLTYILFNLFCILLLLDLSSTYAIAQVIIDPTNRSINTAELINPWLPVINTLVAAIISAAITVAGYFVKQRFNIQLDDSRRDALQTSLTNAAGKIVQQLGSSKIVDKTFVIENPLIRDGIIYVNQSATDAVKHFSLSSDQIAEKIVAKLGIITASAVAVADRQTSDLSLTKAKTKG